MKTKNYKIKLETMPSKRCKNWEILNPEINFKSPVASYQVDDYKVYICFFVTEAKGVGYWRNIILKCGAYEVPFKFGITHSRYGSFVTKLTGKQKDFKGNTHTLSIGCVFDYENKTLEIQT